MGSKETYSGLSRRDQQYLRIATSVARTSTARQKHGSVIISGGRVIATGVNKMRNDPLVLDELSISDGASYHAEYDAMRKLGFEVPSRATIYVARVNKQGVTRLSRPCDKCWKLLLKYEIKEVVYTV